MRYVGRRVVSGLLTIWIVLTLTFVMMHAIPGDFFTSEKKLPEAVVRNIHEKYHLDDPILKQYTDYVNRLVHLDAGPSFRNSTQSVNDIIKQGFPVSARLGLISLGLALIMGIPAGIFSALRRNGWVDNIITFLTTIGISQPSFIIGTVSMYWIGVKLQLLPIAPWRGTLEYYILPAVALSFFPGAYVARLVRSSMLEVLHQDFMRTAKAKGLPRAVVVVKHGLRNAILPVLTVMGPLGAAILTGSFIIERIFNIPGLGKEFVDSVLARDYGVIVGVTVFYAVIIVLLNLIVDLLYGFVDPRINVVGSKE